jgi:hypothetical protein
MTSQEPTAGPCPNCGAEGGYCEYCEHCPDCSDGDECLCSPEDSEATRQRLKDAREAEDAPDIWRGAGVYLKW